ncbi:MAG: HAMP domain-containing histidine kinase [Arcobacteraceae bacterium]|nr:HAMP domain-containing histidine kinase [Arcobacteraceae bacterium]
MKLDDIDNKELLAEISRRFSQRDNTIYELKVVMGKMEDINKKLLYAEENRSKFISIIRNEFNNPLSSMITLSKRLISGKENVDIKLIGDSLYEEVLNLNFQIANIIYVAEIEAGTLEKEISKIDFEEIVEEIKDALQYLIAEKHIDMKINISCKEDPIYQDKTKIYSILVNLISNAISYSPQNSIVELDIIEEVDDVRITVKDYGEGISSENQKIIFERFRQAHSGMNRSHRGQGLGMGIVRDFIEFLGGNFKLESKENKFTIFEFNLPKESQEESMFMDDDLLFDEGQEF